MLRIEITKGEAKDAIAVTRADGGSERFVFPKKGPAPHDVLHIIVEKRLGFASGFWGMIAAGVASSDIQEIAKAGGHASATRAGVPAPSIVQLIQAERLVECFEADLWGQPTDFDTFRSVAAAACDASFVPAVALGDAEIGAIRAEVAAFTREWSAAPVGARFQFEFSAVAHVHDQLAAGVR